MARMCTTMSYSDSETAETVCKSVVVVAAGRGGGGGNAVFSEVCTDHRKAHYI